MRVSAVLFKVVQRANTPFQAEMSVSGELLFTLLSEASVLSRLALALRAEEEGTARGMTILTVDGAERRYGAEGIRKTVGDVRAARIHQLVLETSAGGQETFLINYCAGRP